MLPALAAALASPAYALKIDIDGVRVTYGMLVKNLGYALVPLALTAGTLCTAWWYVVIHQQPDTEQVVTVSRSQASAPKAVKPADDMPQELGASRAAEPAEDKPQERGAARDADEAPAEPEGLQQMGNPELLKDIKAAPSEAGPPPEFFTYFWIIAAVMALMLVRYYWRMEAEHFEVLRLLIYSVMPLGILTAIVLAVILFGITTATESAAVGAAGAFLLAFHARSLDWKRTKEAVFLTAKTTAMVCWLFVGSAVFSAVFAILGGP